MHRLPAWVRPVATSVMAIACLTSALPAQQGGDRTPRGDSLRQAQRLDIDGKHAEARAIFQKLIDNAPDPSAKAVAQRRMAMSHGFEGHCAETVRYEELVIGYWRTREKEEPQNAYYQEGETANEAARICIDAGDLTTAERMYRRGSELGLTDPFMTALMGMVHEKMGHASVAKEWFQKAYDLATQHTPPAFARPFTRAKLGR